MTLWPPANFFAPSPTSAKPFNSYTRSPHGLSASLAAQQLPSDFADYIVYITRETLIGSTNSLNQASRNAHNYFRAVSNTIAYDKMMRNMLPWAAPSTALWTFMNQSQTLLPSPKQQQLLPYFGASGSTPLKSHSVSLCGSDIFNATPSMASTVTASMAFMACSPILFDSWHMAV